MTWNFTEKRRKKKTSRKMCKENRENVFFLKYIYTLIYLQGRPTSPLLFKNYKNPTRVQTYHCFRNGV